MRRRKTRKAKRIFFYFLLFLLLTLSIFGSLFIYNRFAASILSFEIEQGAGKIIASHILNAQTKDFEKELSSNSIKYNKIGLTSDETGVKVELDNGIEVIFSKNKDIVYQVSSLQSILTRLTIDIHKEAKKPKGIDFRYSKPIVNF